MKPSRFETWDDHELLEELDDEGRGLTTWEADFVESLWQRLEVADELTERQREKLEEIADERLDG